MVSSQLHSQPTPKALGSPMGGLFPLPTQAQICFHLQQPAEEITLTQEEG